MTDNLIAKGRKGRVTKFAGAADCTFARELALLGYTDAEIASAMRISVSTLYNWKRKFPEFAAAIASGGIKTNARVVQALLARALGGTVVETKEVTLRNSDGSERIEILKLERYIPPDTRAIIFWLTNREPQHWKFYKPVDHPSSPTPPSHSPPTSAEVIEAMHRIVQELK